MIHYDPGQYFRGHMDVHAKPGRKTSSRVATAFMYLSDGAAPPTAWTTLQQDGPTHLGLRCDVLPEHQIALITSVVAHTFRERQAGFLSTIFDYGGIFGGIACGVISDKIGALQPQVPMEKPCFHKTTGGGLAPSGRP